MIRNVKSFQIHVQILSPGVRRGVCPRGIVPCFSAMTPIWVRGAKVDGRMDGGKRIVLFLACGAQVTLAGSDPRRKQVF